MKKIFRAKWLFAIMFLVAILEFPGKAEAAPQYKKIYGNVLKNSTVIVMGGSRAYDKFAMVDINRDGKKELVATAQDRVAHVYTIRKGKAKLLGDFFCFIVSDSRGYYIEYNKKSKGLVLRQHGGTGLSGHDLYKMKKGKLEETISIEASSFWDNGMESVSYSVYQPVNSNSKSVYTKYYNKYFKEGKVKKIYLAGNTERNRKRKLK